MLEEYRIQNPSGTSAINDYELLRADKGRCFVDKVKGLDIDAIGMQGTVHFPFLATAAVRHGRSSATQPEP